jgi:hypothetical protein
MLPNKLPLAEAERHIELVVEPVALVEQAVDIGEPAELELAAFAFAELAFVVAPAELLEQLLEPFQKTEAQYAFDRDHLHEQQLEQLEKLLVRKPALLYQWVDS